MATPDLVEHARFGHGYLLQHGGSVPAHVEAWPSRAVGEAVLRTHPRTVVHESLGGPDEDLQVVVCGQPLDVDAGTADGALVVERLLGALRAGDGAALEALAALSGRWTAFLRRGTRLVVSPDSHATQPVFWSARGRRVLRRAALAVGSHAVLVAGVVDAGPDHAAIELYERIREFRPKGTIFMPGLTTTHAGVLPVFPNCVLEVDLAAPDRSTHRRVWPVRERVPATVDEVFPRFAERFDALARLTAGLGRVGISLTAGLDSRTTLVGARPHLGNDDFAYTYLNPRDLPLSAGVQEDLYGANELAFRAGLRHRVIRWRNPGPDDPFRVAHEQSFPGLASSLGAATAMFHDLPHDFVELQSILAETGTYFYGEERRTATEPTPRALAALTYGKPAAGRAAYVAEFERLVEYTGFTTEALAGRDFHDITYWEHRMAKWAARKFQEGDMGHRVALPFADRTLIDLMLSLPPRDRFDKVLLHRFLAREPELAAV
ncbi:hypothetical protein KMZ32_11425 [Phycicoccus sp. MAQZ13P-2]|uniref:hypothetical protein n=1 Tax=Phycicoccus mangrovi TaxID=2840470 RepID=UPI001C003B69|nr:hypothetical protein [Phycicoccus mangrovi]MBT9256756.1 hypothetical protein [Phycicoccus mangrovi]MBT9274680.1 hypothetical protein [Phycicoccus mangrovi]